VGNIWLVVYNGPVQEEPLAVCTTEAIARLIRDNANAEAEARGSLERYAIRFVPLNKRLR
jgi:hypothetical protein